MNKTIIALSVLMTMATIAQADSYFVKYNLEGPGSALEKGSIVLVDKSSTPPVEPPIEPPIEPPVEPPTGPVCKYSEEAADKTMWVNGANSYYKVFVIYNEGIIVMESSTGSVNVDTPKTINGITYSKGTKHVDGQYPRFELCVEKN